MYMKGLSAKLDFLSMQAQSLLITTTNGPFDSNVSLNISNSNITIQQQQYYPAYINTLYATGGTSSTSPLLHLFLLI